ncbi:MAG TPA: 4-hydroxy-tetrahydrodipicolinate synthase [Clostridiales bacterium]|jgi:4-hydroxy-tetrahydrodipicolinate synthase|nr:4-hydroxy-tetrahydrodipicolinate synthase [Clostridiales bacterium]HQP69233.1 4-hydroxy-tetrahydrodipicolinate synthase [Clostridiales bacterium]
MEGLFTAIVTPFKKDGRINYESLKRFLKFQCESGVDGIVPGGTTGENPTFTDEEFRDLYSLVCGFTEDTKIKVIAGCGSNSTDKSVSLCKLAAETGCDAALVITPYYNKPNQEGLYRHFSTVADKSPLPVVMYNVPSRTGVNMLPETVERLSYHENIVALKEASASISQVQKIIFASGDRLSVLSGEDDLSYSVMALGGKGVISVASNVIPKQMSSLVKAMLEKDYEKGLTMAKYTNEICHAMFIDTNPIPVKAALNLMGFDIGSLRLPLVDLDEVKTAQLKKVLEKYNLI